MSCGLTLFSIFYNWAFIWVETNWHTAYQINASEFGNTPRHFLLRVWSALFWIHWQIQRRAEATKQTTWVIYSIQLNSLAWQERIKIYSPSPTKSSVQSSQSKYVILLLLCARCSQRSGQPLPNWCVVDIGAPLTPCTSRLQHRLHHHI